MPVEHETKFILNDDCSKLITILSAEYPTQTIHQIYTNKSNRFRKITKQRLNMTQTITYYHTFKKKINGEVLEIESKVTQSDFELIQQADNISDLHKVRYTIPQKYGQWDIDFLLVEPGPFLYDRIFFCCAECEQPKEREVIVPELLKPYIKYEIPYEHSSIFSNFKLSDQEYAKTVIENNISLLNPY
jgi:hypothetical protein